MSSRDIMIDSNLVYTARVLSVLSNVWQLWSLTKEINQAGSVVSRDGRLTCVAPTEHTTVLAVAPPSPHQSRAHKPLDGQTRHRPVRYFLSGVPENQAQTRSLTVHNKI